MVENSLDSDLHTAKIQHYSYTIVNSTILFKKSLITIFMIKQRDMQKILAEKKD